MASQTDTASIVSFFNILYGLELKKPGSLQEITPHIQEESSLKTILVEAKAQAHQDLELIQSHQKKTLKSKSTLEKDFKQPTRREQKHR